MSKRREPRHIVVRYADSLFGGVDVIREHERVLRAQGAVWIGKVGRPLALPNISLLNGQTDEGVPTHLYLVQRSGQGYTWTKATLSRVERTLPADERELVPEYYAKEGITRLSRAWFKVTRLTPIDETEVRSIRVASSRNPIAETLARSMAALFIVVIRAPTSGAQRKRAWQTTNRRPGESMPVDALEEYSITDDSELTW